MVKYESECFTINPDPLNANSQLHNVRLCLFRDVSNSEELVKMLKEGEIDCALINAELVLQVFQVLAAAQRAITCQSHNKLSTHGIHSEIVFALSPSKNITDSLKRFGVNKDTQHVLIVVHDDRDGAKVARYAAHVKGRNISLAQLASVSSMERIQEAYHVSDEELKHSPLDEAIVARIAIKDYV